MMTTWMKLAVKALAEMNNANGKLMMDLAAVMNERDAAQAEAARIDTQLRASLLQHRKDNREPGSLPETERRKVTELTAERDTARAGEARAVEALRTIRGEDIYPDADADGMIEDATCCYCYRNSADGCHEDCPRAIAAHVIDSTQPALDWLAQQRREAAAEALGKLESESSIVFYGDLPHVTIITIREHLAALRAGELPND